MIRAFRYPLLPTVLQAEALNYWLAQCCDLYNAALQERRDAWKKQRVRVSRIDQQKGLAQWRRSDPEGMAVPSDVQRSALARIEKTFQAFYRRAQGKKPGGFPRFRTTGRYDSFTLPPNAAVVRGAAVRLPKLGAIKLRLYRPLRGKVLQVTIRRDGAKRWFASFACEIGDAPKPVAPLRVVGVDVGLASLAVTSDGEVVENRRLADRAARMLEAAHRKVARRVLGSAGRRRARAYLVKRHAHIRNQRLDHARKTAASLVSRYDVVAHEDLNIAGMVRGRLGKFINNAGWGILLRCIALKAESAGKHVVAVDPRHTSQTCSRCGALVPKDLSVRVHDCPHCGLRIDRDWNAAINICALGRSAVPWPEAPAPTQARSG